MDANEYEKKYRKAQEKSLVKRSRSLGTQDWMEQANLGNAQNINYLNDGNMDFSVQRSSWNTGDGMTVTTSTTGEPSKTYTLSSALSMK